MNTEEHQVTITINSLQMYKNDSGDLKLLINGYEISEGITSFEVNSSYGSTITVTISYYSEAISSNFRSLIAEYL